MDFAQGILHKYGWSEGQGLGKHNSGITKPLKANLKFDTTGLGHDGAAEFKDNWWEKAYNSAASNLDVNKSNKEGEVRMELKDGESLKISTTGYTGREGKSSTYGNFVKSDGREEEDGFDGFGNYRPLTRPLTDDELFKACGGRTAHKGARHGLTLSGKLARLAEQDNALLQKISEDRKESEDYNDWQRKISKKKKRRPIAAPTPHGSPEATRDELQDLLYLSEYLESPAAKRREGKVDKELSEATSKIDLSAALPKQKLLKMSDKSHEIHKKHKKDKKKKHRETTTTTATQEEGMDEILNEFRETLKKRIKKKEERQARKLEKKTKRRREMDSETSVDFLDSNRESSNSTDYFAGDTRGHKRLRVSAEDPLVERGFFETSSGIQVEMDDPNPAGHRPEKRSYSRSNIRRSLNKSVGKITDRFARSLTTKEPSDDEGIDP